MNYIKKDEINRVRKDEIHCVRKDEISYVSKDGMSFVRKDEMLNNKKFMMSVKRLEIENDINLFLVFYGYRIGYFTTSQNLNKNPNLIYIPINWNISQSYICNHNTYNKYKQIIDELSYSIKNTEKTDDILTILLGYPCKLPNINCENRIRYSFIIKFNNNYIPIFDFVSSNKINISKNFKIFEKGICHYNESFKTKYSAHFSVNRM